MKIKGHLAVAAVTSGILYCAAGSTAASAVSFIFCAFLDVDHIPDYLYNPGLKVTFKDLVQKSRHLSRREKYYAPLHSYEFIILLTLVNALYFTEAGFGILTGSFLHLLSDIIANRPRPYAYFYLYRARKNFKKPDLFKPE